MDKISAFRIFATLISIAGVGLLVKVFILFYTGTLSDDIHAEWAGDDSKNIYSLLLALPVPLHVISIGMIIQKKWLSPLLGKIAWFSIVTSGVWLGISLFIKSTI